MSSGISQISQPLWRCSLDILRETSTEIEWLIDGVIPAESIILASGREGSMMTWLALEWARSVAEGSPWLGRDCEAASALYLDAENPRPVFLQRLEAIGGSLNLNVWRWQDDKFPTDLADPRLLEAAQSHRLIVVDSLRRFMMGREENSATDMARITDPLRQLTRLGCSVIAIHLKLIPNKPPTPLTDAERRLVNRLTQEAIIQRGRVHGARWKLRQAGIVSAVVRGVVGSSV